MAHAEHIDIVIAVQGTLDFLNKWERYLQPYNLILVQYGDGAVKLKVPPGYQYQLYTKKDVQRTLGDLAWCIPSNTSAAVCFGFLVSTKRYVYTLDPDCSVAHDPEGSEVDPVDTHITNLLTPSTPYFFNTLYDPYREGADFVRGYPFSLREGVPTAMSHGLWLNMPDYDLPTFLVKQRERNTNYVDAVLTVPKGVMFPVSALNLAFDRLLLGPAMYHGSATDQQPDGFCGDLWGGWCCKVVSDHLGYGCKTGLPYVTNNKTRSIAMSAMRGFNLFWQEEVVPFFKAVRLNPTSCTVEDCCVELAELVRAQLGPKHPYFAVLADGMVAYVECWRALVQGQVGLAWPDPVQLKRE